MSKWARCFYDLTHLAIKYLEEQLLPQAAFQYLTRNTKECVCYIRQVGKSRSQATLCPREWQDRYMKMVRYDFKHGVRTELRQRNTNVDDVMRYCGTTPMKAVHQWGYLDLRVKPSNLWKKERPVGSYKHHRDRRLRSQRCRTIFAMVRLHGIKPMLLILWHRFGKKWINTTYKYEIIMRQKGNGKPLKPKQTSSNSLEMLIMD